MPGQEDWFKTWFDMPHYHILYQDRDDSEAEFFIDNLLEFLHLESKAKVLDLACGKGRYSIYLNKKDLNVTGLDLSEQNIEEAKLSENETLAFDIHDMREVYKYNEYDAVLNLFTSFGYFEDFQDNLRTLQAVNKMLVDGGTFVIDFMNVAQVIPNIVKEEMKTVQGIEFHLFRRFDGKFIIKDIEFEDEGKKYSFSEKVQAITKEEFEKLLKQAGFKINHTFGNYSLSPFDRENSDRLIFIATKI